MRTLDAVRESWNELAGYKSLRELQDVVRVSSSTSDECRSARWKAFLLFNNMDIETWPAVLSDSRSAYNSLHSHFLRHLDNPHELSSLSDPLGDAETSLWDQIREDEDLRAEILQDVHRCMPDNVFFRQPTSQRKLLDILFIYCKLNADVGYRQGMHELLAPILWVVESDAIDIGHGSKLLGQDAIIKTVFDADYVEPDTFTLFAQVMQGAKVFYEQSNRENPIVTRSRRIVSELLSSVDPELAAHLNAIEVVPQVFLMRWIRLLFGREFDFDHLLNAWDVIFAIDPTLALVDYVCVAMLLSVRWQLIEADLSEALEILMHYSDKKEKIVPQQLVQDGMYLRDHTDEEGGNYLIFKYTGRAMQRGRRSNTPPPLQRNMTTMSGTSRPGSSTSSALQATAKSLYARSEKLGIGQAVRNAVEEVHKRAQELRQAPVPSPPPTRHQRGVRERQRNLQDRISAMVSREKQLAHLLSGAIEELSECQKVVATVKSIIPGDMNEKLSLAIAKTQFVEVYLSDPSLEVEGFINPSSQPSFGNEDRPTSVAIDDPETGNHPLDHDQKTPQNNQVSQISKLDSRQIPDTQTGDIESKVQSRSDLNLEVSTDSSVASDSVLQVRPKLQDSSLSWMLGQGPSEADGTTLGDSSKSKTRDIGKRENLFGDSETAAAKPFRKQRATLQRRFFDT